MFASGPLFTVLEIFLFYSTWKPSLQIIAWCFPSQIQVIEDDRNNRGSEPFVTGVRGQVPPLVTTNFLVKDQGKLFFFS